MYLCSVYQYVPMNIYTNLCVYLFIRLVVFGPLSWELWFVLELWFV